MARLWGVECGVCARGRGRDVKAKVRAQEGGRVFFFCWPSVGFNRAPAPPTLTPAPRCPHCGPGGGWSTPGWARGGPVGAAWGRAVGCERRRNSRHWQRVGGRATHPLPLQTRVFRAGGAERGLSLSLLSVLRGTCRPTALAMPPKKKGDLQQKSPAEFFAENKNIAGFDNVRERKAGASAPSDAAIGACVALPPGALTRSLLLPPPHPTHPFHLVAGQMLVHVHAGAGRKLAGRGGVHQRAARH